MNFVTEPIEEVARWQYKTVLIIFPLNLQTITITLDVVKWLGRGTGVATIKRQTRAADGCSVADQSPWVRS